MAKKEAKANKENSKNKKSFFKGFKAELKKVIWPTPKQLVNNTTAVIVIVLITAAIVFVLDITFETINKQGIDKIKAVVGNTTAENTVTSNEVSNLEETSNGNETTATNEDTNISNE